MERRQEMGFRRRLTAFLLALCVPAVGLLQGPLGRVQAKSSAEVQAEIDALEAQKAELQGELDALRDDEARQLDYYYTLEDEISVLQQQIDTAIANIHALDLNIMRMDQEMAASEQEISSTMEKLKERVKALYKSGNVGTLQMLLGSNSWTEFAEKSELLKAVTAHDTELIRKVSDYMEATADTRTELETDRKLAAELRTSLEADQAELFALEQECEAVLADLRAQQVDVESRQQQAEDDSSALEAELEEALAAEEAERIERELEERRRQEEEERRQQQQQQSGGSGGGGGGYIGSGQFAWPCPGYVYISDYYMPGDRVHRGIDLAAYYGTAIVAAESGYVVTASSGTWGGGYGTYVKVMHNNTYSTLYAHCSSLAVSYGDYVERGQVIAYVGSTGDSSGNHLHFEVFENGVKVNPAPFIGL